MSEQPDQKSGGRFLSKVVKFIRSPTTDWADLDRPPPQPEPADEASAELKEMIERKRRNDFVRNRELEMLRKVRRRQASGERVDAEALPSLNSNIESVAPDGRSGTLDKIHRIETEMTDAWLDRPDRDRLADQGYEKTMPSDLLAATGPGPGRELGATPAFEETQPAPPELPAADGVGTAAASQATGGTAPPIIDLLDDIPASPEVEEVAIRFANGDVAGAEASLVELLGEGGSHGGDLETWLMLFDLYRAAGEADKFDGAAATFAARFGRSAPQWELGTGAGPAATPPASAGAAPGEGAPAHWVAPSAIGTQSIAALNASLARQAPPWRIDWRRVKTIETPAVPLMLEAFRRWAESPVRLKFLGVDQLLLVLATRTPTGQREVEASWWGLRLALLRVMNEADEFELVALNYCITYEMSPPSWEAPRCECGLMTESGQTVVPQESGTVPTESPSVWLASDVTPLGVTTQSESDVAKLDLVGEIVEDVTAALRPLVPSNDTRQIEFNCRRLRRIDFAAAGSLLNWAIQQQGQGRQVVFQNVNRLVAVFFGVIGISDYARVRRRQD